MYLKDILINDGHETGRGKLVENIFVRIPSCKKLFKARRNNESQI